MSIGRPHALPTSPQPQQPAWYSSMALTARPNCKPLLPNSRIAAGTATLIGLFVNSLAGYALAKLEFKGRERLFKILVAGALDPPHRPLVPLVLLPPPPGPAKPPRPGLGPPAGAVLRHLLCPHPVLALPRDALRPP